MLNGRLKGSMQTVTSLIKQTGRCRFSLNNIIQISSGVKSFSCNYFSSIDYYPEGSGSDHNGDRCNPDNTDDEDCFEYNSDYEHSGYEASGDDTSDTEHWHGHGNRHQINAISNRGPENQVNTTLS